MSVFLDPIGRDGTAYKVRRDGRVVGVVKLSTSNGINRWEVEWCGGRRDTRIFNSAEHAADQIAVDLSIRRRG